METPRATRIGINGEWVTGEEEWAEAWAEEWEGVWEEAVWKAELYEDWDAEWVGQ